MRKLGVSRRDLFFELDRPALKELPAEPYQYAERRVRRVGLDYHVDIDGHYYLVPHRLIREQLDARITERTIELVCKGERVAVHMRAAGRGRHNFAVMKAILDDVEGMLDPGPHLRFGLLLGRCQIAQPWRQRVDDLALDRDIPGQRAIRQFRSFRCPGITGSANTAFSSRCSSAAV
jgi:hypothetical protein